MADSISTQETRKSEIMYPGWSDLTKKEWEQIEKTLDRRYGATAVRVPGLRSYNPIVWLYEFFLDMHI